MPVNGTEKIWRESLELIRKRVNPQAYHTWFSAISLKEVGERVCTVTVPNSFFVEMMAEPYSLLILDTVGSVAKRVLERVEYVVTEGGNDFSGQSAAVGEDVVTPKATPPPPGPKLGAANRRSGPQVILNGKYTFDQFVVGAGNQFAHAAAMAVADNPAKAYNPLFVYGGTGLGKTHLLHAIGNRIIQTNPGSRVCFVSSEQFTNEVINSIRYDRMADFRARYRNVDVLLIDDIQFISGKDRTQEEFFHTFNTLYEAHRQIILSSDRFPKQMPDIEERLRSRFQWGLIADIQPPDLETKIAILQKKAESEGINLPSEVSMLLATNIHSNVRELEGALIRLGAYASLTGRQITVDLARQNLRDLIKEAHKVLSLEQIQSRVAKHFHVKVADLKAKRRTKDLVLPRQVAMYLCRHMAERSFPDIGRGFGGRDHTTVMHACRQVAKLMGDDVAFKASVDQLSQSLTDGE